MSKCNLSDGWVDIDGYVAILREVHISPYSHGNIMNHADKRGRQLLLHKKEIVKIQRAIEAQGMTCVATKIYLRGQRVKVEIALAKGKKQYDKRQSDKTREWQRDKQRVLRQER